MRVWLRWSLLLVATAAAVGCSHHGRRRPVAATGSLPLEATLPTTRIHGQPFDDRNVGTLAEVDDALRPSLPQPAAYRALSAEQCQCLAVKASSEGDSMASERRALTITASPHGLSEDERLKIQVLWASELEARNHSAAEALTTYYHIAQAEADRPILAKSLQEIDDALANVGRLRQHGVQVPFDDGELKRQRLALLDKQLELTGQLDQLNAKLVQLLGLSTPEVRPRLWPTADLTVVVAPSDIDLAVAVGVATRPELRLLSSLRSSLKAKNVAITRGVVGGASTLVGSQSKFTGLVSLLDFPAILGQRRANRRELPTRQRQLAEHYEQRRREVTAEIQQAVLEAESSLRRTAVEKETVVAWRSQLDELAEKKRIDEATFVDITRARLRRLEAESDEIEQIVAWKIALVKVKEAQGVLVTECQGAHCGFLDFPVIHETSGGPTAEFHTPEDGLPEPPRDAADTDETDEEPVLKNLGDPVSVLKSAAVPTTGAGGTPSQGPRGDTSIGESDLPDMAVEPPQADETVNP